MKIIEASHEIENGPAYILALQVIEAAARTCYKSENKIKEGSAEKLIRSCIRRGHESILEHISISVRFICSRGISHEMVRHRLCAFSQESTRYVRYDGEMEFIRPQWLDGTNSATAYDYWNVLMEHAEYIYKEMLSVGNTPQEARDVLPNALKTELVMTANLRTWRHILNLRTDKAAHPDMRALMKPLLVEFKKEYPVFFEGVGH